MTAFNLCLTLTFVGSLIVPLGVQSYSVDALECPREIVIREHEPRLAACCYRSTIDDLVCAVRAVSQWRQNRTEDGWAEQTVHSIRLMKIQLFSFKIIIPTHLLITLASIHIPWHGEIKGQLPSLLQVELCCDFPSGKRWPGMQVSKSNLSEPLYKAVVFVINGGAKHLPPKKTAQWTRGW